MKISENTIKKAELLSVGEIYLSKNIKLPVFPSKSTAGPSAGKPALTFSFGTSRVKLELSKDKNNIFSLVKSNGQFQILRQNKLFIDKVEIVPTLLHAPNQAFINLEHRCIYNCKFCVSPKLERDFTKNLTKDKIVDVILKASEKDGFESVALTSGIAESLEKTIEFMVEIVKEIRKKLNSVPIGVEPYITDFEDIEGLYKAGANELKLNLQSYDREIFAKICPDLDYDSILKAIKYACEIFGKGKVCSNLIIGLGESDESVIDGVKALAEIGAVTTLRALRINEYNLKDLTEALGKISKVSPKRLIYLAQKQKEILERYNLTPLSFKTMCHRCGCCDIVPFVDL